MLMATMKSINLKDCKVDWSFNLLNAEIEGGPKAFLSIDSTLVSNRDEIRIYIYCVARLL